MPIVNNTTLLCWQCSKQLDRNHAIVVRQQSKKPGKDFDLIIERIRYYCHDCINDSTRERYDDPFDQ